MFGIGETEFVIILIFAFLIFGPDKLPGMGRTVGRALRQFREAQDSVTKVVQSEIVDPLNSGLNEPAAKKRAEQVKAARDEDADIEGEGGEAPRKPETFAERRARLAAEREAKASDEAAQAAFDAHDDGGADESVEGADTDEDLPVEEETPKTPDLASLYAMKPASKPAAASGDEADAGKEE